MSTKLLLRTASSLALSCKCLTGRYLIPLTLDSKAFGSLSLSTVNAKENNKLFSRQFSSMTVKHDWNKRNTSLKVKSVAAGKIDFQRFFNKDHNKSNDASSNKVTDQTKPEQLKLLIAQYGGFAGVVHIVLSLTSLGFFYLLVSSGIDVVAIFGKMGIELSSTLGGASNLLIAYTLHKVIMPLRISLTVVTVPMLVRYFRRIGYFKK
uniref:Protein FAM210B, mitochondrial n=1 Tax=Ciona intestinalis TaxID=7719 RepID=F6UPQ6_CIOIN|nr:protein FAM210B, mitochondrial isoform X1 [Ciona intestinalis]|eukprot:XP_002129529.1 protein FAM210B, mitochondrial isoform X1 [Ciona intestinalis]